MVQRSLFYFLSFFFVLSTACGGCDEDDPNNCNDVDCERGICDLATGECSNAPDCGGDDVSCLDGFTCAGSVCEAEFPCDGAGNCERGVCNDGACLNPDSCNTNQSCLPGSFCSNGSCEEDPCDGVSCDRGICEVGIGECVNAETCNVATEEDDCLEGFQCVEGECISTQEFCDNLACTRGVCSVEEGECIDAEDCAGDDMNCTQGNYCAPDNTCQQNLCDTLMTNCPRGVCDSGLGQCVNANPCTSETECVDGNLCIDGACVPTEDACAVGGCPGNQTCEYDGGALSAACAEAMDGCTAAVDCIADRVCEAGACAAPGACSDDGLEPNNVAGAETDYFITESNGAISDLSLCGADVDLFGFDTANDPDLFGVLSIVVRLVPEDVGLGTVTVELVNGANQVVASGNNDDNGTPVRNIEIRRDIDVITQGVYTIRVSGENVNVQGIRYELRADVLDGDVLDACVVAAPVDTMAPQLGDTSNGTSAGATTCADISGNFTENIWTLDVPADSYATIRATPQVGVDVALSIRSVCGQDVSQLACSNTAAVSDFEEIALPLPAGTYYIIVEGVDAFGGGYLLSADLAPVICTAADNTCLDPNNANVCNATGTAFDTEACANGCDAVAGRCDRDPGDVCETGIPVTGSFSTTITWLQYTDDYQVPNGSTCVPNAGTSTDLEDYVMAVTIPDNNVLRIFSPRVSGEYISMYLVTDCQDIDGTCLAGENSGNFTDEELIYQNTTGADINAFLIVDRGTAGFTDTPTPIEVEINPSICTPGESVCVLNRESQTCNSAGTAYDTTTICDNGCDVGTGECIVPQNDLCSGAIVLTPGVPAAGDISILNSDYSSSTSGCSGTSNGRDAVYLLENLQVGYTVTIDLASDFDTVLWVGTDCDANDNLSGCFARADSQFSGMNTESLTFAVATAGDYFVVADTWSSSLAVGSYTITATVTPPVCNPGDVLGCFDVNTLEYCDEFGQPQNLACTGGCLNGVCGMPDGDFCFDAIPLSGTPVVQTFNGDYTGKTNNREYPIGFTGQCYFTSATDDDDVYFTVDVPAGSTLSATFDGNSTANRFYGIRGGCGNVADGCFGNLGATDDHTIEFFAPVAETILLVVDATFGTTSSWSIDYTVTPTPGRACTPNTSTCNGNSVELCDSGGLIGNTFTCPGLCTSGFCEDDVAASDTCTAAPDVSGGAFFLIDYAQYTDSYDPASCTNDADGTDAHYQITIPAGEILHVVAQNFNPSTAYEPVIYIYDDCMDPDLSCIDSVGPSNPGELFYSPGVAQTVYVAIDNESSFVDDPASVLIETLPPNCVVGQAPICNGAGNAIEYCDSGLLKEFPCGGAGICSGGACTEPEGDVCFDPILLTNTPTTTTVSDSFSGATNGFVVDKLGGAEGGCYFDGTAGSPDRIYAIDLNAGDLFTAQLTMASTFSDAYLAIVGDCTDTSTCKFSNRVADVSVPFSIQYYAPVAETVYLIAIKETSGTTDFDIDYDVQPNFGGSCSPGLHYCVDATTVAFCDVDGNSIAQSTCANGCSGGACTGDTPGSDTCIGAPVIQDGAYMIQYFAEANDDSNLTAASCVGEDTPGSDVFYAVNLLANDILTVEASAFDEFDNPILYIFTDCADIEGSCITATNPNGNPFQSVTYQSPIDQQVYIAWDMEFTSDTEWNSLQVSVASPNCVPGMFTQACNVGLTAFEFCDDTGFIQEYDCGIDGCDAGTGRCTTPIGEVCLDPFDGNPAVTPEVFSGSFALRSDDYSLETGNACTGSITPGGDDVYVVDLTAGQTLTASLVSTELTPEDVAVYITTDCGGLPASCVGGSDVQPAGATPEVATYVAAADETVYVIVDSFFIGAGGTYSLTVDVQ